MSFSPVDLDYLTPSHFLIGQPLLAVPDLNVPDKPGKLISRWKLLHQCHQAFWRRWSNKYLCSLQARSKGIKDILNLKIGDMVIVKDIQLSPTLWRLDRIIVVSTGADGVVRVAHV